MAKLEIPGTKITILRDKIIVDILDEKVFEKWQQIKRVARDGLN